MKIQLLDPAHILAILSQEEARILGLSLRDGLPPHWASLHCRLAAARIFAEISRRYQLPLKNQKILLRASQIVSGETALFFTLSLRRKTRYHFQGLHTAVYEFSSQSDLLRAASAVKKLNPAPAVQYYQYPKSANGGFCWRMIVRTSLQHYPAGQNLLGDFACFCGGVVWDSVTQEHGEKIDLY